MENIPINPTPILVVDDDEGLLLSIKAIMMSSGLPEPALVSDSSRVVDLVSEYKFKLVLQDLVMPQKDGIEVLEHLKAEVPQTECIIITAIDDVASAVKSMRYGAFDYLVKPIDKERLLIAVERALERYHLKTNLRLFETQAGFKDLSHPEAFQNMIARDSKTALVFKQAEISAVTDYSVVLTGETGTGKEMLARIIHRISPRCAKPFVGINMAAVNKSLIEDELFGHTKGAFTGAVNTKKGFFEEAHGGTLFLDEFTELKPEVQGALLRVIQEKEFYRVGSTRSREVDVRIMAATNRKIEEAVQSGNFREDLYYRLNMYHIRIPPLRERQQDIIPLAKHFIDKYSKLNNKNIVSISKDVSDVILNYAFPGNVRELENIIASAVLHENSQELTVASLDHSIISKLPSQNNEQDLITLKEMEQRHILQVLNQTNGNRTHAAQILGISIRTLQRRLKSIEESE